MQTVAQIMTRDVEVLSPQDNLRHAAEIMRDRDIGALPVCDGKRLLGMLTDRDITVRGVAAGRSAQDTVVSDLMSGEVMWCYDDQTVDEVLQKMGDAQIRRIPVIDHNMQLVGIVALGDLAKQHESNVDDALAEISMPGTQNRQSGNQTPIRH